MSVESEYKPGVYRKGDDVRVVETPTEAVNLLARGYVRQGATPTEDGPDYRELQRQAKELGIPATGTKEELAAAVSHAQASA